MKFSYSRVSLFDQCPYHFKLRYIYGLTEIPDYTANHALIIGHALHTGIETDKETMLNEYFNAYPIVDDLMINESIKLEYMLPKVKQWLSQYDHCELIHEYEINTPDYRGHIDLIIRSPNGTCTVVDFKYSNNTPYYLQSNQLHVYKYYLEQEGFKVDGLAYLFIDKLNIRQGKKETLHQFRQRLIGKLKDAKVTVIPVDYDPSKVEEFIENTHHIESSIILNHYPKNPHDNCFTCNTIETLKKGDFSRFAPTEYLDAIQNENGEIMMILPTSERRNIEKVTKRVFWLYGAPFSGKTTFANEFPNPLMLNTDGNIRFVDAPFISIADKTESTGRVTNTTRAWDIFKDSISELEKKDNDFKTIVIDLLEDTYEHCRIYMYDKMGIEHESDNSFKAWDMVRTEFLSTMKRVIHLDYENIIFLSHEDTTKDVTKKSGDKITSIKPNLQDKAALKVAGMVDIVGRVVADDEERKIIFKSKDYVFGGGRLPKLPVGEIDLDVDKLVDVYDLANKELLEAPTEEKPKKKTKVKKVEESKEESTEEIEDDETPPGEEAPTRKRRERTEEPPAEEEKPKKKSRRSKK